MKILHVWDILIKLFENRFYPGAGKFHRTILWSPSGQCQWWLDRRYEVGHLLPCHQRLATRAPYWPPILYIYPILHIPCHQQLSTLAISSHQRSQYGFKLGPVGSNTVQSISCAKQNVQSIITSASLISLGFCSVKWSGPRVLGSRSRVLWQFRSRPWSSQRKLWNRCYQGGT